MRTSFRNNARIALAGLLLVMSFTLSACLSIPGLTSTPTPVAQIPAVPSTPPAAAPTATVVKPTKEVSGPIKVAQGFEDYYKTKSGSWLLGNPIGGEVAVGTFPAQYFEKGRLEDHSGQGGSKQYSLGLLVDELQQAKVAIPIGGIASSMTYANLSTYTDEGHRVAPPPGYPGYGAWTAAADGTTFIPFTPDLRAGKGHLILGGFWNYINRKDLFPDGWLTDLGLPISEGLGMSVTKNLPGGSVQRNVLLQAFQRAILIYDPANPPEWQIERVDVGTDYRRAFPERVGP